MANGNLSEGDKRAIVMLQNKGGNLVKKWQGEYREKVDLWKPALRDLGNAMAIALGRYKSTLDLKKAQEQAAIEFAFGILGLGFGASLSWIAVSLKKTKKIGAFSEAMQEVIAGGIQDGVKFGVGEATKLIKPESELSFVMPATDKIPTVEHNLAMILNNTLLKSLETNIVEVEKEFNKLFKKAIEDKEFMVDIYIRRSRRNLDRAVQNLESWAKSSANPLLDAIYYKARPEFPSMGNMARMIERGIWAKWLLANTKVEHVPQLVGPDHFIYTTPGRAVEGRLVELRVMKPGGRGDPGPNAKELEKQVTLTEKATWNKAHVPPLPNFGWRTSDTVLLGQADKTEMKKLVDWAVAYKKKPEIVGGIRDTGRAAKVVNSTPY